MLLASQLVNLKLGVSKLVLCELEISFALKPHVVHLLQALLVLALDILDLLLGILKDLAHRLFVVPLHRLNLSLELLNLVFLDLYEVGVVLQLLSYR